MTPFSLPNDPFLCLPPEFSTSEALQSALLASLHSNIPTYALLMTISFLAGVLSTIIPVALCTSLLKPSQTLSTAPSSSTIVQNQQISQAKPQASSWRDIETIDVDDAATSLTRTTTSSNAQGGGVQYCLTLKWAK
ncbi:unnamed protein product [Bursaphelenchus xylophilus]|uniref:(pine wood nematode) hypothetical protein n=1 Tax=Bursaphelenchus xylophilus TaxID=6326 RepID=A0A1I7SE58_BURXY|nr:unnamed protein product [Bursaphelenchus xylophilus]CAG9104155.1 unnamed protein product [Bursaphelenchus xylophilus]